jgi:lysophospholipase L1-like esterase
MAVVASTCRGRAMRLSRGGRLHNTKGVHRPMKNRRGAMFAGSLIASLGLNAIFVASIAVWVARKGGPRYVLEQLNVVRTVKKHEPWQRDWIRRNKSLPNTAGEVVFVGDSIMAAGPWAEYFSDIRNRGIGGDTTDGLLQRLDEVLESRPKQVFLNIGTNDLSAEVPVDQVVRNVEKIVTRVRAESPAAELYLCSVLPINLNYERDIRLEKKFRDIGTFDEELKRLAATMGVNYIDLRPAFSDERGYLKPKFTSGDGLHLNDLGYAAYCKALEPYVKSVILEANRSSPDGASPTEPR